MDKNKIIIIALIAIIAVLIIGLAVVMPGFGKDKSNITIKSNDTISQGDSIKIELADVNGTPIENETVNVTVKDVKNGTVEKKATVTNDDGVAKLKMDDKPGNYTVECKFDGNENYSEDTTTRQVEIVDDVDTSDPEPEPEPQEDDDPGAFYSQQEGRIIYTGEIHDAPDGHRYKHLGYNEWEMID